MSATIHRLANSVTRKSGFASLAKAELRMMQALGHCTRLEGLADESAVRGNKWMAEQVRAEIEAEVVIAGDAMREVMLFRLELGIDPHPLCRVYEVARGVKR